ncbi:MAG: response regulator transcription factor [Clostridiales bacterium]|jgi:DNA-binding response OmpR family regulator|uniref:Stage 0 sporulation protein A homolog n=1 Tax=Intestinimonas massiliensis (ex Afouda et al. 2020) TaxID=1673721 RepID=A0ABS9MDI9_9FIRM|nr:response regulator transcription factor [Intestinimonas massiliensis (ex Afouda et al. 2020)]MBS6281729.1 response regulator transcription factor [Oscillospiraceae bacterium]MDU1325009.1 response regulator transcription factor [Clostridiales bacterium]CUP65625.1 transcriptional regulatory protein DltR [Flavonifractor plautii]SCI71190.1 Response regulator ArlR [uncultured Flavonifractor sp.]MCG4528888.1 response regulator transcription factor [Intestinimonas massiliensis (ex Afouda et al. 20
MKILIIEDDKLLAEALQTLLEIKGFDVEVVYDGEDGTEYAETGIYDLLIMDVMMPKLNGYQMARQVRHRRVTTPILMLTAKSETQDRIEGLNAGADYYLTKPFDNMELLACINALLRRKGDQVDMLRYGNTTLDLTGYMLSTEKNSIRLSKKEFDVMRRLMQFQSRSIRKDVLLTQVWGYESNATENNVEAYVGFLRKKLKSIGSNLKIESIRLLGYHLEVTET